MSEQALFATFEECLESVWPRVRNATPISKSTSSTSTRAILISCPECGSNLEVAGTSPVELEAVDEDDEDDDEEEERSDDDDDDFDDDDAADGEDEEGDGEDWEE